MKKRYRSFCPVQSRERTVVGSSAAEASLLGVCIALGLLVAAMSGCQRPLFGPFEPRSQFDRNDTVRDRRAPAYVMDEFGNRRPNVRGRLVTVE